MAKFTKGIYINQPRENTPDFVKGSIDIKADTFLQWIEENPDVVTDKGYIKLQITTAYKDVEYNGEVIKKKGDWEVTMNDYFYKDQDSQVPDNQKIDTSDLPFN